MAKSKADRSSSTNRSLKGAALVEYVMLMAFLAILLVPLVLSFGGDVRRPFEAVDLDNSVAPGPGETPPSDLGERGSREVHPTFALDAAAYPAGWAGPGGGSAGAGGGDGGGDAGGSIGAPSGVRTVFCAPSRSSYAYVGEDIQVTFPFPTIYSDTFWDSRLSVNAPEGSGFWYPKIVNNPYIGDVLGWTLYDYYWPAVDPFQFWWVNQVRYPQIPRDITFSSTSSCGGAGAAGSSGATGGVGPGGGGAAAGNAGSGAGDSATGPGPWYWPDLEISDTPDPILINADTVYVNEYGVNTAHFLLGTDAGDGALTPTWQPGVMGFLGNDVMATGTPGQGMTYIGGPGNDTMTGGAADDLFLYHSGDGQDLIRQTDSYLSPSIADRLRFVDLASSDATFSVAGDTNTDLVITLPDGGSVTMEESYDVYPRRRIEFVEFTDRTLTHAEQRNRVVEDMKSTGMVIGSFDAETYYHSAGDPSYSIVERERPNWVRENVLIFDDLNRDQVTFALSEQNIDLTTSAGATVTLVNQMSDLVGEHIDEIRFADGVVLDHAAIRGAIQEGITLVGDVEGTASDDWYYYRRGNGVVSVTELGGFDRVVFPDYNAAELTFGGNGSNLVITGASGDQLTLIGNFRTGYNSERYHFEEIQFADGGVLNREQIHARYISDSLYAGFVYGTTGDDVFPYTSAMGSTRINESSGGGADNLVFTDVRSDEVTFGRAGSTSALTITGSFGTVQIDALLDNVSWRYVEEIAFSDGVTYTAQEAAERYIVDAMATGPIVYGTTRNDVYDYYTAFGTRTVSEFSAGGTDVFHFRDLNLADLEFHRASVSSTSLVLSDGAGAEVTLVSMIDTIGFRHIDTITFASGETLTPAQMAQVYIDQEMARGGTAGSVSGTKFSDTYTYTGGTIAISETYGGGTDNIVFVGLNQADVSFTQAGNHLVVTVIATGDQVTVTSFFDNVGFRHVETLTFADGALDRTQVVPTP